VAIVNTIADWGIGNGIPVVTVQRINVTANTGATNVTLPATGAFAPTTVSRGLVRVKSNVIGVNATAQVLNITGTDGTTTVDLSAGDAIASRAGIGIDHMYQFQSDLNLTSITVAVNIATNNSTVDVEMAGIQ
jgi:hypothetical protein